MIKTFEEWCGEKGIKIEEVSANLLPTAYRVWGEECYYEAKELKTENAALRERLEKAVNKRVVANMLAKYFDCPCNFSPIDEEMFDFCNECCNDNVICWEKVIEKSNAEARLAELKGGKNE